MIRTDEKPGNGHELSWGKTDARDAGSRCASFRRNGYRTHSTGLLYANPFQASSPAAREGRQVPHFSGRLRTRNLQPSLYVFPHDSSCPFPGFSVFGIFGGFLIVFRVLEILCILSQNCSELHFYAVNKDEIGTMVIIQNQV